jgi:NADH-quinone oxidoreductase subunit I
MRLKPFKVTLILILRQLFLWDIIKGLLLTARYLIKPKVTMPYPEAQTPRSNRFRGIHALRRYQDGSERCIACQLCEAVCPAEAITVQPAQNNDGQRYAALYEIDLFKCVFCGLCEESCPVDAIVQTNEIHYVFDQRGMQILDKKVLLAIGDNYEESIAQDRAKEQV